MTYDWPSLGIAIPNSGEEKQTCPECSHTRKKKHDKCLNVNGETGLYNCWHCGNSGKAPETERVRIRMDRPKAYVKPTIKAKELTTPATSWFAKRGITNEVLERNHVTLATTFMPQVGAEVTAVAFPYFRGGEVINCKYRDHAKNFRMESGAERLLYGYDDIASTTIIVEGEMDKLSVEVAGFRHCVSVPDGAPAPNTKNIESKFDWMDAPKVAEVKRWIIAVDNDAPGARLQQELIRRFGPDACLIASWPDGCKDANDVLIQHGAAELAARLEQAVPVPVEGVHDAAEFTDDFLRMYDDGVPSGYSTGWDCVDESWRIQPGQLTVVTGIPGHGKSEFVDALCVNLAIKHGWTTAFYSPENYPVKLHMMKLAEKLVGKPYNPGPHERMTRQEASEAADWLDQHFFWVMPKEPSLDEILVKAKSLVLRKGIRVLVIDPWNEVEHSRPQGKTEAEYVSESLMRLRRFAREHELTVFVIAHPRLLQKDAAGGYPVPTPYDISGGAMWRNKADNCLAVYAWPSDLTGKCEVHVQKVKFKLFGRVGKVEMQWDRLTGRYSEATGGIRW